MSSRAGHEPRIEINRYSPWDAWFYRLASTSHATRPTAPYATTPTMTPRPSISSPFVHHLPVPTRARAAPTVNSTARLRTVDHANRLVSMAEKTYGTSG